MLNPRSMMAIMAVTFLGWVAFPAHAEQSSSFGDYVIHYNAIPSTFLTPDTAREYGISRSRNRAMLNISVQEKTGNGLETVAVPAKV